MLSFLPISSAWLETRYPPGWITSPSGSQATTISKGTSIVFEGPSEIRLLNLGAATPSLTFVVAEELSEPKTSPDIELDGDDMEGLPAIVEGLPAIVEELAGIMEGLPAVVEGLPAIVEGLAGIMEGLPAVIDLGLDAADPDEPLVEPKGHESTPGSAPPPGLEPGLDPEPPAGFDPPRESPPAAFKLPPCAPWPVPAAPDVDLEDGASCGVRASPRAEDGAELPEPCCGVRVSPRADDGAELPEPCEGMLSPKKPPAPPLLVSFLRSPAGSRSGKRLPDWPARPAPEAEPAAGPSAIPGPAPEDEPEPEPKPSASEPERPPPDAEPEARVSDPPGPAAELCDPLPDPKPVEPEPTPLLDRLAPGDPMAKLPVPGPCASPSLSGPVPATDAFPCP